MCLGLSVNPALVRALRRGVRFVLIRPNVLSGDALFFYFFQNSLENNKALQDLPSPAFGSLFRWGGSATTRLTGYDCHGRRTRQLIGVFYGV